MTYSFENNIIFKVNLQKLTMEKREKLRSDGLLPSILIETDNIAGGVYKAIIACHDYGCRIETPKFKEGQSLGYDADINIRVKNPDSEPKVSYPAMYEDGRGLMQYILEVTHGIHNHWLKSKEHPEWWGYTYNQRVVKQLPFVFHRIKHDWEEKKRISGRDYQFTTWRPEDDIVLEQEDPPCWQRGHLRFIQDSQGVNHLSYVTDWRSRDLLKAWNENVIAQVELQKLIAKKVSNMLGIPIELGTYTDRSSSLHLYGLYVDRDDLENRIQKMKEQDYSERSSSVEEYFGNPNGENAEQLKRLIAAQMDAEAKGHGLNQSKPKLTELGYDLEAFDYPKEWDSWPESWDIPAYVPFAGKSIPNPDLLKK